MGPSHLPCSSLTHPAAILTPSIGVLRWIRGKEPLDHLQGVLVEAFGVEGAGDLVERSNGRARCFFVLQPSLPLLVVAELRVEQIRGIVGHPT